MARRGHYHELNAELERNGCLHAHTRVPLPEPKPRSASTTTRRPWYFEKTGPAFFNEWSLAHVGWGALFQFLFPGRHLAGLALHTFYEAIEGHIFPAEFRDVSMRNHVGDTAAFVTGMLAIPSPSTRSASGHGLGVNTAMFGGGGCRRPAR